MAKIIVRSKDEIPDEQYRKMVLTLMDRQAGREIAGAEVYGQALIYAPTYRYKLELVHFQEEELGHFKYIADLMADLGIDMDEYIRNGQRGESRFTGDQSDLQVEDWIDAVLFNFMTDRAAAFKLAEYAKGGSYAPLAKAETDILSEEEGHKSFGEMCFRELCRDPKACAEIQRRLPKWFAGALRIFGRPGTARNKYCIEVGLKTRDSGEVAADYLDSIRPVLADCKVRLPRRDEVSIDLPPGLDLTVPGLG